MSLFPDCLTINPVIPFFFFLFGIVIGSFLNVCISRIPEGLSIVSPGSRCPRCLKAIKPYDNIPVFGWLLLGGKCRNCKLPISPMYPIVEFITGAFFVLTYYEFGLSLETVKWLTFICLLIVLFVTDLQVRMLPDAINWPGFGVALVLAAKIPPDGPCIAWTRSRDLPDFLGGFLNALLGAAVGSFLLWGAAFLYKLIRKREGMGMGDVKMMAMVGAFLGARGAFLTILLGTLFGSVLGLTVILGLFLVGWKRKVAQRASRRGLGAVLGLRWAISQRYQLPLGTFLGVGAALVVYAAPWIDSTLALFTR